MSPSHEYLKQKALKIKDQLASIKRQKQSLKKFKEERTSTDIRGRNESPGPYSLMNKNAYLSLPFINHSSSEYKKKPNINSDRRNPMNKHSKLHSSLE